MRLSNDLPETGVETDSYRTQGQSRVRTLAGAGILLVMVVLLYRNRTGLLEGLTLARTAQPFWLGAAFTIIMLSYLASSQVFRVVLHSLGRRSGVIRLWGTAITTIVISQALPAGAIGSYAFLMASFKRREVTPVEAAVVAAYEALSYVGAMVLIASFSLIYLGAHAVVVPGGTTSKATSLVTGFVAAVILGAAAFILTRSEMTLTSGLQGFAALWRRATRRGSDVPWNPAFVTEFLKARRLIVTHTRMIGLLICIQLVALSGHSFALLLVLKSLGVTTSFPVVLTAFGFALITSTVNVLPGGGGTVETVLAAVLTRLAIGPAALPASILFRLLNFWALLPVVAVSYRWLTRRVQTRD